MINDYAIQIIFSSNEDILCYNSSNNFIFYSLRDNKYIINQDKYFHEEEGKILLMRKLINDKIMYLTENYEGNKLIKFIDLNLKMRDGVFIRIEEKNKKLKVIDLLVFYDYIIIGYNYRVDIINYIQRPFQIKTFEYFDFMITNIIVLASNRILLGLYDSEKRESIIREQILRIEDLQNNLDKFESIGCGNLKNETIDNILKMNESQVLINVKNSYCIVYERKNKIGEKFQKKLMNGNNYINYITDNGKNKIINIKDVNESDKNNDLIIQNKEELNLIEQIPFEIKSNYNNLIPMYEENKIINFSNQTQNMVQNINNYNYNNNEYYYNNNNYKQYNNINNKINIYKSVNNNNNYNQFNNINDANNNLYKPHHRYTVPNNNYIPYPNNIYPELQSKNVNINNKIDNNTIEDIKINQKPKEKKFHVADNLNSFFPEANKTKLEDDKNENSYLNYSASTC